MTAAKSARKQRAGVDAAAGKKPAQVRVRVLYFANLRETAGVTRERLMLPSTITVSQALIVVAKHRPAIAAQLASCQVALNGAFAAGRMKLKNGDELAILPPVAGG